MDDKEYFISQLRSTSRTGIDNVINQLESLGFFSAPASTVFHLNIEGGLLIHSVNVCKEALALREMQIKLFPEVEKKLPVESVIIASLLHDVCKADIYKKAQKKRRLETGKWESYIGYDVDYSIFPLGHGEKSVIRLLQWGLHLTDDEICAIRWHMQAWDLPFQNPEAKGNINEAKKKTPLVALIIAADNLATSVLE